MTEQQKEIETIRPRQYTLNLSEADVKRLARKAGQYNLTAAELLENFIGDLVCGTYSNGSDERMYAEQWAERCYFAFDPDKDLIAFFCGYESSYEIEQLFDCLESIEGIKADIEATEHEIENPVENWKDFVTSHYDKDKEQVVYEPSYNSLEEYIAEQREDLESMKEALADEEAELQDIQKEFADYMGGTSYEWEEQLQKLKEWYRVSISEAIEPDTEE